MNSALRSRCRNVDYSPLPSNRQRPSLSLLLGIHFSRDFRSGRIRFTDINTLNDAEEMRWGYSIFEEAASKLIKLAKKKTKLGALDKDFFDKVDEIIAPLQGRFHPFVSCFSRTPDLSAQWNSYADEGRGFAIGFAANALKHMPVSMLAVEYERDAQVQEMMDALGACYLENEADETKFGKSFFESCVMIGAFMIAFKNPKFQEEKEIRCLHAVNPERTDNAIRLVDHGGILGSLEGVEGEIVRFRIRDNALSAYLDMPFRRRIRIRN